jgi:hypothetical protein
MIRRGRLQAGGGAVGAAVLMGNTLIYFLADTKTIRELLACTVSIQAGLCSSHHDGARYRCPGLAEHSFLRSYLPRKCLLP